MLDAVSAIDPWRGTTFCCKRRELTPLFRANTMLVVLHPPSLIERETPLCHPISF